MEDTLRQLSKEIITPKFAAIKHSCTTALNVLQNEESVRTTEAWRLRELCLEPLQMALESKAKKLSFYALAGIQHLLKDERFHSTLECGEEEHWLPVQVLSTLHMTPQLPEDVQVNVMKLLLTMTLSTAWCMNAGIVIRISQLYWQCFIHSPKSQIGRLAAAMFRQSVGDWASRRASDSAETIRYLLASVGIHLTDDEAAVEISGVSKEAQPAEMGKEYAQAKENGEVNGAVKEDEKNSSWKEKKRENLADIPGENYGQTEGAKDEDVGAQEVEDGDDMLADFKMTAGPGNVHNAMEEVVTLLKYLIDRLDKAHNLGQNRQILPLLLEGIHAILSKVPALIRHNSAFQELIWQQLCPVLISLLGIPKVEKGKLEKGGNQRGPQSFDEARGFLTSGGGVGSSAKIVYGIAAELVRLVGSIRSLRPVLEALFHRILLYPPPPQRLEALKVIKELFNEPERIIDMAMPTDTSSTKVEVTDMGLIKLILNGIQEGCHCNDLGVCVMSVTCVDNLLHSLEALTKGQAIPDSVADDLLAACGGMERGLSYPVYGSDHTDEAKGRQQDWDGGSVGVSSGPLSPPDSPRPIVDSDTNSECSMPDVVKRVTCLRLSDVEQDSCADSSTSQLPEQVSASRETTSPKNSSSEPFAGEEVKTADCAKEPPKKVAVDVEFSPARKAMREESDRIERQNAAEFVQLLRSCISHLLTLQCGFDVDELLQTFASNFCSGVVQKQQLQHGMKDVWGLVLNADGVYTASIATLKLAYALSKIGFYATRQQHLIPLSQVQFVDSVLGSGLLLYLSPTWLSELYQQTLAIPLMDVTHLTLADSALLQLLEDVDGMGSREIGGQFLYEYHNTKDGSEVEETPEIRLKIEAGQLLARSVLSSCWEAVLDVLCVLLEGRGTCGITFSLGLLLGTEGAREETQRARDAICLSLSGLQRASRLCCMLGLQSKCSSAFAQLANVSCAREDLRLSSSPTAEGKGSLKAAVLREKSRVVRLHAAHILSMDVLLTTGLEVGSHAADCWKHVFRCCVHVSELEHTYFSHGNHESSLPRIVQQERYVDTESCDTDGMIEMEPVLLTGAAVPVAARINVAELIRQSGMECGWDVSLTGGGVLTAQQAAQALCGLSQAVDTLFEDAAKKLNLQALLSFLSELGEASRLQLRQLQHRHSDATDPHLLVPGARGHSLRLPTNALHLYRLQQALMTVVHSRRPLLHLVRVWAAASPYLVEATGHRDNSISKMAVTCIHDFIVAVLTGRPELPHFHINEFLCKTFEDMLCLELCDSDVQDQIVCSICELVEACTQQLQSGWRPLFGALRSVRIEYTANEMVNEARQRHVAAVLDVFEVYLNTDNILVFANATVDCILCLLKYVHGSGMFEDLDQDDDGSDSGSDVVGAGASLQNLCVPALGYLSRCCTILASMWKMPACPVFKGAFRIQLGSQVRLVDPTIPNMDVPFPLEMITAKSSKAGDSVIDSVSLASVDSGMLEGAFLDAEREGAEWTWPQGEGLPTLVDLDKGCGVLHVWYLLLDGLATAISACPRSFQSQTLTTLFTLLKDTAGVPGVKFSLYCINHLLLPMLQAWLRRGSRLPGYWDSGAVNFKQCCGLTADLVVEFIGKFVVQAEEVTSLELMLKQLFIVLIECVAQPIENLSLLGCSCIRHVMLSAGSLLTESMWLISTRCLAHAVAVTTHNLRLLMALFHPNSDNFYGDIGQVKVATRKDCVAMDNMRLKQLARQVFLLESQVTSMPQLQYDLEDAKSFVFLIYPPEHTDSLNADHITARVPLRDMVVGLLSNQLLLQTLGSLLLGSPTDGAAVMDTPQLPGLMGYMSTRTILRLLETLEGLYTLAVAFDMRPGLKFLLQKVAGLEVAANQYRLAGVSMVLYLHTLTHLCAHLDHLDIAMVKKVLEEQEEGEEEEEKGKRGSEGSSDGSGCGISKDDAQGSKKITEDKVPRELSGKDGTTPVETVEGCTSPPKDGNSLSTAARVNPFNRPHVQQSAAQVRLQGWKCRGLARTSKAWDSADVFLPMLRSRGYSVCRQYLDILAESQTESLVDRMAGRPLFFLLAQPEDISEITRPLLTRQDGDVNRNEDRKGSESSAEGGAYMLGKEGESTSAGQVVTTSPVKLPCHAEEDKPQSMHPAKKMSAGEQTAADNADPDLLPRGDGEKCGRQMYSKRQMRAEMESKVYSVATDTIIQNLIGQYRRHKQQNAMPSTFVQFVRHNRSKQPKVPRKEPVDEAIDKQQQCSIMKDSEARQRSWSEMLVTVLRLFLQLPERQFSPLLPVVSPCITLLIANARDPVLRDVLAQWFQRLGCIYDFMPVARS